MNKKLVIIELMKELTWSEDWWTNRFEYYHAQEDAYYCEKCAYSMFDEREFERVGSDSVIKQMIKLCKSMLDRVKEYAKEQRFELKWRHALEQHKLFYDELIGIK